MKGAGSLVPVNSAKLGPADGQITIRAKLVLIHETVEWAVHGLDLIFLILDLHLLEHPISVEIVMAGRFPQVQIGDMGRVNDVITIVDVLRLPKILNVAADDRPLGMPKHEAATSVFLLRENAKNDRMMTLLNGYEKMNEIHSRYGCTKLSVEFTPHLNREQIKLLPKDAMITLLRLLHHLLVLLELNGILPRRGIDTLEHFAVLVASPIGASHGLKRDGLLRKLSRRFDVRSGTQIPPLVPNVVDGDWFRLDGFEISSLKGSPISSMRWPPPRELPLPE